MNRLLRGVLYTIITLGCTSGCGGGANDASAAKTTSSIVAYQFTANIESYVDAWAPFPAAVGDTITGTIKYDPNVSTQSPPAGVQVKVRAVTINSDSITYNFPIAIQNDLQNPPNPDGSPSNMSDIFSWITNDTSLSAQYGVDWIQTSFVLDDPTGTAFSSSRLPATLNLSDFSNAFIGLGKEVHGVGLFGFCRAKITSLQRI